MDAGPVDEFAADGNGIRLGPANDTDGALFFKSKPESMVDTPRMAGGKKSPVRSTARERVGLSLLRAYVIGARAWLRPSGTESNRQI